MTILEKRKKEKNLSVKKHTNFKYTRGAMNRRNINRRAETIKGPQSLSSTNGEQYTEGSVENKATPQSIDFSKKDQTPKISKPVKSMYSKWSKRRSLLTKRLKLQMDQR